MSRRASASPGARTRARAARARRRAPRTCARGSARAAAGTASGRRRARAAWRRRPSPEQRTAQNILELSEHPPGRVAGHRRRGSGAQAPAELVVVEEATDGSCERHGVAGWDEQSVLAVADHLADPAGRGREHGRAHGERLDDGVGKVLPARGEDRRVGRREELDDAPPWLCAEETDAIAEPELDDVGLDRGTLVSVARDREVHPFYRRERLEGDPQGLLGGQASRERQCVTVEAETA